MASGPTPRRRKSGRQGESATGTPKGDSDVLDPILQGLPGDAPTETAPPTGIAPAADSAVAAASAAATAAAAAVSAAIAATAANNASRARSEPMPAPAPATPAPSGPAPAAPAQPPLHVPYERPPGRDIPGLIRANHDGEAAAAASAATPPAAVTAASVAGHVSPPDVPDIARTPITPVQVAPSPSPPQASAAEGGVATSTAGSGWKARILGPVGGVAVALLAAGSALGHSVGGRRSSGKSARETPSASAAAAQLGIQPPMPSATSPYARSPYALPGFLPVTQVADLPAPAVVRPGGFRGTAPYRFVILVGSILAVVFLPIILGLGRIALIPAHAISGRLAGGGAGGVGTTTPDFDEYGNPSRKRRISPLWLAFGGFYGFLAVVIGAAWLAGSVLPPVAANLSPTSSDVIALLSSSPSPTPSPSAKPTVITAAPTAKPITPKPATPIPATPIPATPIPATPIPATPIPATPIPATSKPVTPKPTVKTTPVPTPTPQPTNPILVVTETAPIPVKINATFRVQFIPGSSCFLTRAYVSGGSPQPSPTPSPRSTTQSPFTIGTDGWSTNILYGSGASAGTWHLTSTCTPSGGKASVSNTVTVVWK